MTLLPPLESLLETTAVCTTVLQFLSGTIICRKFFQKKSTGDTSGFPFMCGFLSCSFWLRYGILSDEDGVTLVNLIGAILFLLYTLVYYIFTVNKKNYLRMFGLILVTLISVLFYINTLEAKSPDEAHHLMGIICCIVTVCFFAAPLTMLFHVIRCKNSEPLPFVLIVMGFASSLQWLIFGIMISDTFVQIPNFLGCILSLSQLFLFVIYPPKSYPGQGYKLVEQTVVF